VREGSEGQRWSNCEGGRSGRVYGSGERRRAQARVCGEGDELLGAQGGRVEVRGGVRGGDRRGGWGR